MGRDDAYGTMQLDANGALTIDFDIKANHAFYEYVEHKGRLVAKAADAYFLPDVIHKVLGRLEVPHNLGGIPMGNLRSDGVVDHAGRMFGCDNLMVLDGSIIPHAVGPNPALTITAIAERAMDIVVAQLATGKDITADEDAER
jgi:cholesterol oxidase